MPSWWSGDVNATAACAMVGAKLWIPVVHLEAGLRSRDRRMPEEINRLVTDAIADLLWTPSRDADANLRAEGVAAEKIDCIGNIMIDSFEMLREKIEAADTRERLRLGGPYAVVTLHRPSNVDAPEKLAELVAALVATLARAHRGVRGASTHPQAPRRLQRSWSAITGDARDPRHRAPELHRVHEPGDALRRLPSPTPAACRRRLRTLGIPCATLRENTERPITVTEGTNRLLQPRAAAAPRSARRSPGNGRRVADRSCGTGRPRRGRLRACGAACWGTADRPLGRSPALPSDEAGLHLTALSAPPE